jgi:Rho family protein
MVGSTFTSASSNMTDNGLVQTRVLVIGDKETKKTEFLTTLSRGYFPTHYVPTVFENWCTSAE